MIDRRQFHRIQLSSIITLSHHGMIYKGQLETISITGCLIHLEQDTVLPKGGEYDLTVNIEGEHAPLQFSAEVVNVAFAVVGIKFISYITDSGIRLAKLIEKFSAEPDVVMSEKEKVRRLFANYYRDE